MYFVQKEGVYFHGIYWIGEDLEEAKQKAKEFASKDVDDYHSWVVYKYSEATLQKEDTYNSYCTEEGKTYEELNVDCTYFIKEAN